MSATNGKTKIIMWLLGILVAGMTSIASVFWSKLDRHVEKSHESHSSFVAHDALTEARYAEILRRLDKIDRTLDAINGVPHR